MNVTGGFTVVDGNRVASYIGERATQALGSVVSPAPSEPKTPLLFLHRLVKRYGEAIAVNELSLTLAVKYSASLVQMAPVKLRLFAYCAG